MTRTLPHPQDSAQHFVFEDASWGFYEKTLKELGGRHVRVTYDRGRMEIMSPLPEHEDASKFIGRLIEMLTFVRKTKVKSLGSTTFKRKSKAKGVEPDQCYYFRDEAKLRGRKRIDLRTDPPPELVVEVDITNPSIAREPIYAALGVPEIWRFDGERLECLHLAGATYNSQTMSLAFPFLEPALLNQFLNRLPVHDETSILGDFVAWVRKNHWAS